MRDGMKRSAAIEILCRHLGIGCLAAGTTSAYETSWAWHTGEWVHIRIGELGGWQIHVEQGHAPFREATASNPLATRGPTAADILGVCRTGGLIPDVDTQAQLRPVERMAVTLAKVRTGRRDTIGPSITASLLLIIERLSGVNDYLTEDHHGA